MESRNIEELWNKYENLLKRLSDDRINKLLDDLGQRIAECSINQRKDEPYCGYGGLLAYSLELAKNARAIASALNYDTYPASIIKVSLLSGLGYIGTLHANRFIECKSNWHIEKLGQYFDWNPECVRYSINHMTLFYINHYKIQLSWEEWITMTLLHANSDNDLKFYDFHKPRLATLMLISKEATIKKEKDLIDGTFSIPF